MQSPSQQPQNKSDSKSNLNETDLNSQDTTKIYSHKIDIDLNASSFSDRNKNVKSQHIISNKSSQEQINISGNNSGREVDNSNDDTLFGSKCEKNNSFVIIKLETQQVPFVSIQFIFHSSINYHDRIRLLEVFNEKIRDLNLKNCPTSMQPVSSSSIGSINSTVQNTGSFPTGNQSFEEVKKNNNDDEFYECCQVN